MKEMIALIIPGRFSYVLLNPHVMHMDTSNQYSKCTSILPFALFDSLSEEYDVDAGLPGSRVLFDSQADR